MIKYSKCCLCLVKICGTCVKTQLKQAFLCKVVLKTKKPQAGNTTDWTSTHWCWNITMSRALAAGLTSTGFSPNVAELGDWLGAADTRMSPGITCSHNVTQLSVPCQTLGWPNLYLPNVIVSLNWPVYFVGLCLRRFWQWNSWNIYCFLVLLLSIFMEKNALSGCENWIHFFMRITSFPLSRITDIWSVNHMRSCHLEVPSIKLSRNWTKECGWANGLWLYSAVEVENSQKPGMLEH